VQGLFSRESGFCRTKWPLAFWLASTGYMNMLHEQAARTGCLDGRMARCLASQSGLLYQGRGPHLQRKPGAEEISRGAAALMFPVAFCAAFAVLVKELQRRACGHAGKCAGQCADKCATSVAPDFSGWGSGRCRCWRTGESWT